jgi:hypothetical protein
MSLMIYLIATGGFAIMELFFILMIVAKIPSIFTLIFAKNLVWEVQNNGNLIPYKAKIMYGKMNTKKGNYQYGRKDTVNFHGKTGIIVNESDAMAIRARIQPVFSLMKKLNIQDREYLEALIYAPFVDVRQLENYKNMNAVVKNE